MENFVGIDNSSLDHKIRVIDNNGNIKLSFTVENNYEGFKLLHQKLLLFKKPIIGFELPHGPIVDFLHYHKYNIYSLNPLKIKRYKETLKVSGNKNDDIDALAIAEYLRNNKNYARELLFNSSSIERLKILSIIHTRLTNNRARHINKLHFVVRQYFPLQEMLFSRFGCTIHIKMLIKYQTFSSFKTVTDLEIKNFLIENKYSRPVYIDKLINKIRNYNHLISEDVEYAYQMEAQCLCEIIQVLNKQIKAIKHEMNKLTTSHKLGKCFKSLPGSGDSLSSKLLSIFGDNKNRFCNANDVQCLFGTAPKNHQSGNYHKVIMRKACNKSGRSILYMFAFTSLRYSSWAREYYDRQRDKGKTHSVAIRALSNK